MEDIFFELIQVALGNCECLSKTPNEQEWKELYALCQKQAVSGIAFHALDGLNKYGQKPPLAVLYEWIGDTQTIETRNLLINKRCVEICQELSNDGFDCCILKGQGNAMMYTYPLLRTSGDIDLLVINKSPKEVIKYVRAKNPAGKTVYHHIDYGIYKEVEIEVHYRPSFMFNPIHNWRLQNWFRKMAEGGWLMAELPEGAGSIRITNREFNIIFQLSHVYNHLLHEGIGLRQIIDYSYVLKSNTRSSSARLLPKGRKNFTNDTNIINLLNYLGLAKIAGAMMWVLHEKLGLTEDYLIAPMDEKRGKLLLNEIMRGGNFGHYDSDNINATSRIKKNVQRIKRDLRLMRYFPSECIWEPWFRVYHLFWRMAN